MMQLHPARNRFFLILFSFIPIVPGCEVIDPEEDIPAFIRIEEADLITDPSEEGSDSHDIRYVWVFIDDQLIGVHELPAKVFTRKSGERNIKLQAGVQKNGMSQEKERYPFYRTFSVDTTLHRDSTVRIEPRFQYFSSTSIDIWNEDFEDPNSINFEARPSSDTTVNSTNDPSEVFAGNRSGKIELSPEREFFLGATDEAFEFEAGDEVYVELDYKTSDTLNIGFLTEYPDKTFKRSFLNIRKSNSWKKIYIQLSQLVGEEPNAISFEVFIQSTLRDNADHGKILIDDLKVLHQSS